MRWAEWQVAWRLRVVAEGMYLVRVVTDPSFLIGCVAVYGAWKKWAWLVDPPVTGLWWIYSQSLLKRLFGARFVRAFTFALGVTMMLVPLVLPQVENR
jgi:hypothetical protein